jgi:hypothetical protein
MTGAPGLEPDGDGGRSRRAILQERGGREVARAKRRAAAGGGEEGVVRRNAAAARALHDLDASAPAVLGGRVVAGAAAVRDVPRGRAVANLGCPHRARREQELVGVGERELDGPGLVVVGVHAGGKSREPAEHVPLRGVERGRLAREADAHHRRLVAVPAATDNAAMPES